MNDSEFTWFRTIIRMIFATLLILCTYNPEGYSYYHWGILQIHTDMPAKVFVGVVLLLAWGMYIRSAGDSFGYMGAFITASFFGTLLWMVVKHNWLPQIGESVMIYSVLVLVSWIVATGFSFSLPKRKGKEATAASRYNQS